MATAWTTSVAATLVSQAKDASSRRARTSVSTTVNAHVGNVSVKAVTRVQIARSASLYTAHATPQLALASATRSARTLLGSKVKCGQAERATKRPVRPTAVATESVPKMGNAIASRTSEGPRVT